MKHECPVRVREVVVDVEEESMKSVFEDGPNDVSDEEADHGRSEG